VLAGGLIGLNRGSHGSPAGLRTTLLVTLAASIAMIQANLLLGSNIAVDNFLRVDVMRLPLGILTGVGFIGGGVILHRGNLVVGVTTAAALWFSTVMGLCFGGGQWELGFAALGLGILVLWILRWVEALLPQDLRATVTVIVTADGPPEREVRAILEGARLKIGSWAVTYGPGPGRCEISCQVRYRGHEDSLETPSFVGELARRPGVRVVKWDSAP
jgi:putative Mg2+ transporter-C (MgtC) family protein